MPKFKEWHLRREQGVWCVYHRVRFENYKGTGAIALGERRISGSPDIHQAIRLGRHHAADLAMLKLSGHA